MQFSILVPSSLPVVEVQPGERHTKRTASVFDWYDRHRSYSTFGSNEEEGSIDILAH